MSDTALAATPIQARSPRSQPNTPRKTKISAQLRSAIEAMVWLGLKRDDAAQAAGMKDNSLYVALRRPDVKAAYLAECEVLRVSGRARRIHRLEAMVEQDDNKAAVINAALALDRIGEADIGRSSANSLPGLQIVIVQGGAATQVSTAGAMTIEHDSAGSHKPSD